MCLLDRLPEELEKIQLTQPPHQQRFSLGESITPGKDLDPPSVEFELLELVTDKDHIPLGDEGQWDRIPAKPPISSTTVWDPHTRCMDMPELKTLILNNMTKNPQNKSCEFYKDPIVTSLPIALQLNDPCYYLNYKNLTPVYQPQTPRQLWSGPTAGAPTTAPTPPTPALPIATDHGPNPNPHTPSHPNRHLHHTNPKRHRPCHNRHTTHPIYDLHLPRLPPLRQSLASRLHNPNPQHVSHGPNLQHQAHQPTIR